MASKHDGFKDFVLDQLSGLPGLTHRAMFGGYGLYEVPVEGLEASDDLTDWASQTAQGSGQRAEVCSP